MIFYRSVCLYFSFLCLSLKHVGGFRVWGRDWKWVRLCLVPCAKVCPPLLLYFCQTLFLLAISQPFLIWFLPEFVHYMTKYFFFAEVCLLCEVCPPCWSLSPIITVIFAEVCPLPQYFSHFWSDFCRCLSCLAEVCPSFHPNYAIVCPPCRSLSKSFCQSLSSQSYSPIRLFWYGKKWRNALVNINFLK